jgi:predicted TIM-barrel fold metal-dependent hydrolase
VIVDAHTHIFAPDIAAQRERLVASDATFGELYSDPRAKLATADDLLASMDAAAVDVSIAVGFAWSDAVMVRAHNDYLLETAAKSDGRIVALCTLPLASGVGAIEAEMRRCVAEGAKGFGELRPDNLGFDVAGDPGKRLGQLARELDVALMFHASEPVGHSYAGKRGGGIDGLNAFVVANPGTRVILAHLGGGLPFYAHMPEVRAALADVRFDTAACNYLYEPSAYTTVTSMLGAQSLLFGSDFPLVAQKRARGLVEAALDAGTLDPVLGDNAASFLRLGPVDATRSSST